MLTLCKIDDRILVYDEDEQEKMMQIVRIF